MFMYYISKASDRLTDAESRLLRVFVEWLKWRGRVRGSGPGAASVKSRSSREGPGRGIAESNA